jgi:hypothetical protein
MESRAASAPWPLEPGETALWSGTPSFHGLFAVSAKIFACVLLLIGGLSLANAFPFEAAVAADSADAPPGTTVFLDSSGNVLRVAARSGVLGDVSSFAIATALCTLVPIIFFASLRRRFAACRAVITDRRILLPGGAVFPRDRLAAVTVFHTHGVATLWCHASAPDLSPAGCAGIGPLRAADAAFVANVLQGLLGAPPPGGDAPAASAHAFPPDMPPKTRDHVLSLLAPGERVLWAARPRWRLSFFDVFCPATGLFLLYGFASFRGGLPSFLLHAPEAAFHHLQMLAPMLAGRFGAVGVCTACSDLFLRLLMAFIVLLQLFLPLLAAAARRRRACVVTDRRVLFLDSPKRMRAVLRPCRVVPAVRQRGRRRADIRFPLRDNPHDATTSRPLAFRDLPADAIPAFLAALGIPSPSAKAP